MLTQTTKWVFCSWCLFLCMCCAADDIYTALPLEELLGPPSAPVYQRVDNRLVDPNATLWGPYISQPKATNNWWSALLHGAGLSRVATHPYAVSAPSHGVEASPGWPLVTSQNSVISPWDHYVGLTAVETPTQRHLQGFDQLGVTFQWTSPGGGSITSTLLQGIPFITGVYDNLTPRIAVSAGVLMSAPIGSSPMVVTGSKFKFTLNSGRTWLIYTSKPVTLKFSSEVNAAGSIVASISATQRFTGVMRVAHLQNPEHESILDASSDVYPTGGRIEMGYLKSSKEGEPQKGVFKFIYSHASMTNADALSSGCLLMYAMPHHKELLVQQLTASTAAMAGWPVVLTSLTADSLRGRLTGVLGNSWALMYDMPNIGWGARQPIRDASKAQRIAEELLADRTFVAMAGDPYFGAAEMAAMGRLAVVADELSGQLSPTNPELARQLVSAADTLRTNLKSKLTPWLNGQHENALAYDQTWGGAVPRMSVTDHNMNFGAGQYNDHHYHWGYFLYAIAAVAKADPGWVRTWQPHIMGMVRDIANPNANDPFFPFARYLDFFESHSWASGLPVFMDGKTQESTSEAVNAWYSLHLLGLAMGDQQLSHYGQLLTALEIKGAQAYYHVPSTSDVYPKPFADNKVVGVLWQCKADYLTWFGNVAEFMHGIQYIPFTPVSEELLQPAWMRESLTVANTAFDRQVPPLNDGFRQFLYMGGAVVNPEDAWNKLSAMDRSRMMGPWAHHPKAIALYWAATRP